MTPSSSPKFCRRSPKIFLFGGIEVPYGSDKFDNPSPKGWGGANFQIFNKFAEGPKKGANDLRTCKRYRFTFCTVVSQDSPELAYECQMCTFWPVGQLGEPPKSTQNFDDFLTKIQKLLQVKYKGLYKCHLLHFVAGLSPR